MNSAAELSAAASKLEEYADSINVRITFLIVTNLINMVIFLHSIAWLATTVQHRNQRLAKMSSSRLNALVCVGSSFASVAVALRSLQIWWLSVDVVAALKHLSILTISIAFTLVVLTTALKALRIYILFSRPSGNLAHMKNISLQCYVGCAVAIDTAICLSWYLADPIQCQNHNLAITAPSGEVRQQSATLLCHSSHWSVWIGALCGFKLLLLVMLVVFSVKIRGVTLAPLNDARQNLVVAGVVGAAGVLNLPILLHAGEGPQGAFGPDRVTATVQALSVFICQLAAVTGLVAFKFRELQSRSALYKPRATASASESQTPLAETMSRMQQQAGLCRRFLRTFCPTPVAELEGSQPCSLHAVDSPNGTHSDDHRLLLEEIANLKCALSEKQQTIQNLTSNLLYDSEAFKLYLERYHRRFYSALKEVSFIEEHDDGEEIWHLQAGLSEPRDPICAPEFTSTPVNADRNYPNCNEANISWCLTEV